jgi:chemotaxis protein methyltransferase CheR
MSTLLTDLVTDDQLARYAEMIYARTGIRISSQKKTLLSNRLRRRLRATGIGSFEEYLHYLQGLRADHAEWDAFLQEITTHETYLFRDANQWEWFSGVYLDEIQAAARSGSRRKSLRIWSAACSTGDEACTIACCIADKLMNHREWQIEILGTDIGIGALEQARQLVFGARAMRFVPPTIRTRFFKRIGDEQWALQPPLKQWLRFRQHNLLQSLREPPFDLVFVKNVLIYFDTASKRQVFQTVQQALAPGGLLVSGPAEGIADLVRDYERLEPWLHRKPVLLAGEAGHQGGRK